LLGKRAFRQGGRYDRLRAGERGEADGARLLIVHHPDGGFRRFKLVDGGKGVAAADGAEAVAIARTADRLEASVDGDRYRFPATMLSDDSR
jgi:hypothetical protein